MSMVLCVLVYCLILSVIFYQVVKIRERNCQIIEAIQFITGIFNVKNLLNYFHKIKVESIRIEYAKIFSNKRIIFQNG